MEKISRTTRGSGPVGQPPSLPGQCRLRNRCAGAGQLLAGESRDGSPATGGRRRTRALTNPLAAKPPHFAPKAKACIFIFLEGAPSQLDLFDPKPKLNELDGQPLPESLTKNMRFAFIKKEIGRADGLAAEVRKHGESGMEFSDFPAAPGWLCRRYADGPLDAHRSVQSSSGAIDPVSSVARFSAFRRWAPGSPTAWGANRRICPATSCSRPAAARAAALCSGRAVFCRRCTPACRSAIKAIRC